MSEAACADWRGRIFDFLLAHIRPELAAEAIIYGNQNDLALPTGNDYCIYFVQDHTRRGTTVERYQADEEALRLTEAGQMVIRCDLYGGGIDAARARALNLEMVWRSSIACDFFRGSGMMPLFADSAQDTTFVGGDDGYLRRYTVNLTAGITFSADYGVQGFAEVPSFRLNEINRRQEGEPTGVGKFHVTEIDTFTRGK